MKTVLNILTEKLNSYGYNDNIINSVLSKFDLALIENSLSGDEETEDIITVEEYEEPNVEIIQLFLNVDNNLIQTEVLEGDISLSSTESAIGSRFAIADYSLHKRSAVIGMTTDLKIKVIIYKPTPKIQNLYNGITYEQNYKNERDGITKDYYDAFVKNGRVTERKVREILTMLLSDFVIDEMAVYDTNPRIKMYDNEYKYAENLYSYSLRYINIKNNRIEILNKKAKVKRASKNVQVGMVTNDPYIKIDKLPPDADFPLNTISYYWLYANKSNQEEIGIFVPARTYAQATFSELKMEDPKLEEMSRELARKFRRDANQEVSPENIKNVLSKLNLELMVPSVDIIRANLPNKTDTIEPIKYKYQVITDPAEFEEKLYITIEDNLTRKYKYRLVENVLEDLTTIGNKLEYTDEKGGMVRKQSIADFNVNAPAVIIRRETFIDGSKIPDLLGYIYEDMKYYGTEGLPVPSIEVDFYLPQSGMDSSMVVMYNGTSLDFSIDSISKHNLFNSDQSANASYIIGGNEVLPGSTYVTVRYINSKGEILKENKVGNVFPKTTFLPDVIPTINDKDGKEWTIETSSVTPFVLDANPDANIIELKYIEKYARLNISFINREGKNIGEDKQELVQVGSTYDISAKGIFTDKAGEEWKLIFSRPSKLVIKEEQDKNKLILVYDIERADITISCVTKSGEKLAEDKVVQSAVDKPYKAEIMPFVIDSQGLGWNYIESSVSTVIVKGKEPNHIKLMYEPALKKVITRIRNKDGILLTDEKIEFKQVGQKYSIKFDDDLYDYECKEWSLSETISSEITVDIDENKNVFEAIYAPKLAKVAIKFLTLDGRAIKPSAIQEAQIGARYNSAENTEIVDNFGKVWKCKELGQAILVTDKEHENIVNLKYEPLTSKVTIKYFDIESKELISPKYETLQVGTEYKNVPMQKITDADGKRWIVDADKVPTIVVKKHEEENIISIYYNKEMAKAKLTFFDAFNNQLREPQEVESQIGALLDSNLYQKITDSQGGKWMMESSEPKNLMVKESNNSFKLIYGEVKAKVLVKHIDVKTQKSFVEDTVTTVKLGGIYVPNIRQTILDKNKWSWKYIGDQNISIVTRENEQENIIILTYEEDRAKVILKYRNTLEEKIREDAIKDVQIGKEIKIDPIQKFNDNNGLGWEYSESSYDSKTVKAEDNIIINYYEPLMADVVMRYLNDNGNDIISPRTQSIQVGKKIEAEVIEKVRDGQGAFWQFEKVSAEEIIVKEEKNEIIYQYSKLLTDVTVNFYDTQKELIDEPVITKVQIGTIFEASYEKNYTDKEGKAWLFESIDYEKIKVSEEEEKNVINIIYKKEMIDVKISFFNVALQTIKQSQIEKAQIGSNYLPTPPKEIIDDKMLGWVLKQDEVKPFKVTRSILQNVINISYEKYLVDVAVEFKDEKEENIIENAISKQQVGMTFMPKIEDYINDLEGREWILASKTENKLFSSTKKVDSIVVSQNANNNIIKLHYKPSLTKVVIKYQDPLGTEIRASLETEAQIGSNYKPEIIEKIVGIGNVKWMYNPNSKSTIKIDKDNTKNVVYLAYEAEKTFVIYKYTDELGNKLKDVKKVLVQIGSVYKPEPENVIEGEDGRVWEYKAKNVESLKVADDEKDNIIEVVYMPFKVNVTLKFITLNGKTIVSNKTVKAQLGSDFRPDIDSTLADDDSKIFKFVKCEPERIKVKEVPIGSNETINEFTLTYEGLFSIARVVFKDVDGNKLKDDVVKELQVGTVFSPSPIQFVTDNKGIKWELISDKIDSIRVKEDVRENQVTMVYEVAKAEVVVRYKDTDGNMICESDIHRLEMGSEFIPEVKPEVIDSKNRKWTYVMTDPIKLTVSSANNIINIVYQEKKVMTTVKVQATDGRQLKDDIRSKQQVGSKYSPQPASKVIYENNDIWRYAYNSPSEIVVSENVEENVIIQYYTTDTKTKTTEVKGPNYNVDVSKLVSQDVIAQIEKEEEEKRKRKLEEEEKRVQEREKEKAEAVVFTDEFLKRLERNIVLTNPQKEVINKLNEYNSEIVRMLHEALSYGASVDDYGLEEKLNNIMREEKQLVQEGLREIIEEDRNANKLLQIFEAITASELSDKDFGFLQSKKAIPFADYFVNKKVTDREEADYIINRGKIEKGIECINEKIARGFNEELIKIKVILIYQKAICDNCNRARSVAKDEYFKSEENKMKMSREVILLITNELPNQAVKFFNKCMNLTAMQRNELDAIMRLLTDQQILSVNNVISKIPDGKVRKTAIKLFKEIVG